LSDTKEDVGTQENGRDKTRADKKGRRAQPKLVTKEYLNERVLEMGVNSSMSY